MADEKVTKRPWTVVDFTDERGGQGRGYIEIQGPNNEKIATIFPFAGIGGVGIDAARQNAILITILANAESGNRDKNGDDHWSDCAVNNGPALPVGECDCGGFHRTPRADDDQDTSHNGRE